MSEFLRETEGIPHDTEFVRALDLVIKEEIEAEFGKIPEEAALLHDHVAGTYRIHGYHPEHDAEEGETATQASKTREGQSIRRLRE